MLKHAGWSTRVLLVAAGVAMLCSSDIRAQRPANVGKPFENTYRRPAISPYNNISSFSNNPQQSQNIYQQIVQPQLQQQRQEIEQLQQRRQIQQMQTQVANMNSPRTRQLDESIRPTGHASTYMNYSHFYPMPRR